MNLPLLSPPTLYQPGPLLHIAANTNYKDILHRYDAHDHMNSDSKNSPDDTCSKGSEGVHMYHGKQEEPSQLPWLLHLDLFEDGHGGYYDVLPL